MREPPVRNPDAIQITQRCRGPLARQWIRRIERNVTVRKIDSIVAARRLAVAVYREVHAIIPSHDSKRFTNHRRGGGNAGCEFMTLSRIRSATCAPTLSFRFHALTVRYRPRDQIREHFFPIDLFSIKYSQSRARVRSFPRRMFHVWPIRALLADQNTATR